MGNSIAKKKRFKFKSEYIFEIINAIFLGALALSCLLPFVNLAAVSLSGASAASTGLVGLWPVDFSLEAYGYAFGKSRFILSIQNSLFRVVLGVAVNMGLTILTAYPLSKTAKEIKIRSGVAWFFVITMLIGGGMIPTFLIVTWTGLRNTIWALIIPGAVPVFNVVVLQNFFKTTVPKELDESAALDGAGDWRTMIQIYLPLSMPCIATLIVFITVGHWNEWFNGMIYLDDIRKYPLATYLHNVLKLPRFDDPNMTREEMQRIAQISSKTLTSAQVMIATIPIIMIYPFLQRFFVKGMTLGSLKG